MWKSAIVFLVCMSATAASVDDAFITRALGVSWGATLQQVQSAHPGGLTWPVKGDSEGIAYVVPGDSQRLGVATPVKLVQFLFTKDNELRTIFIHFAYSDRESALYDVAEQLGHDYDVKDEAGVRKFCWKPGKTTQAQFEVGSSTMQPWAHLGLQTMNIRLIARK